MSRRKNRTKAKSVAQPTGMIRAKFDLAQTTSQNRNHWANADGLSARASVSAAVRRVVRMRSRYEAENNSWYSGIIQTAANHIVGNGPRLQVLTENADGNARLERAWRRWASMIDLADIVRMCVSTYWRDGEVFLMRASKLRNRPYTLDLRLIEADQVGNPMFASVYNDPFTDDGIRFDRSTNELSFHVFDHHPGSHIPVSTLTGEWYSADEVLHLFRAERPGQTRGIPRATPALQMLPIMRRQEMATLYTAESAANFGMYMKTNSSAVTPASNASADFSEHELARNMLTILPEGWEIGQVESKQPGPQYEGFQRQCLMSFSRCTQMPYGLAAGTSKDSNFSSFKGDIKQIWEPEVLVEQNRIEHAVIERVFGWFLEDAIYVTGLLDAMPLTGDIDHRWHWPPLPELDAVDAATAAATRLATGQSTLTQEHARRGQDWSVASATAAADFGVTPEQYKAAVFSKTFDASDQQSVSVTTGDTAGATVADTAMNGAQVTSIVEIIAQVAAGVIPVPTAKALIQSAFPAIPLANVTAMLAPFANVATQPGVGATPALPQGEYTEIGQRAFSNNQKRIKKALEDLTTGAISQVMAEQTLASIGLAPDRIAALIADALDGGVEDAAVMEVAT